MSVKLGKATLRELRIHLCQTSKESAGIRDFIKNCYVSLKQANPDFPILIRECQGVQPRIWARYANGVERSAPLTNLAANDVMSTLKKLVV